MPAPPSPNCSFGTAGCLNSSHWERLWYLGNASGSEFIFGISYDDPAACAAGSNYSWAAQASANAARMLAYMGSHGQRMWGFEVGNEVNLGSGCNLTAAGQAAALVAFGAMAAAAQPGAAIVGPDTGDINAEPWLQALLPLVEPTPLYAVTNHQYNGALRATWDSPAQLNVLLPEILWFSALVRALSPTSQVWVGEVGPHGGGNDGTCGPETICATYASSIWYADDMGLRAANGHHQRQRQDLFGGAYGLTASVSGVEALGAVDAVALRPDYWTAFLFKRTLGPTVFNASSSSELVRAYAFAGAPPSPFAAAPCLAASLQLLIINLANASVVAALPHAAPGAGYAAWTLGAGAAGVFGAAATLNTEPLPSLVNITARNPLEFLQGITTPSVNGTVADGVSLAAQSTTFICIA